MANFAVLNNNNEVIFVAVIANEDITLNGLEVEQLGVDFLFKILKIKNIYPDAVTAKQTSYNGNFRNKYAGIGDTYNSELDIFMSPKPEGNYIWSQEQLKWIEA